MWRRRGCDRSPASHAQNERSRATGRLAVYQGLPTPRRPIARDSLAGFGVVALNRREAGLSNSTSTSFGQKTSPSRTVPWLEGQLEATGANRAPAAPRFKSTE